MKNADQMKTRKPLTLAKETLKALSQRDLARAAGGYQTLVSHCWNTYCANQ